jgi:hypothetical protein
MASTLEFSRFSHVRLADGPWGSNQGHGAEGLEGGCAGGAGARGEGEGVKQTRTDLPYRQIPVEAILA